MRGSAPPGHQDGEPGSARQAIRRQFLRMVVGVLLGSGAALAIYHLAGLAHASRNTRGLFTMLWTAGNFAAVAFPLRRIRELRRGPRQPRR